MNIVKTLDNNTLTVALEGALDTTTAPDLEKELADVYGSVNELVFDFTALNYISSAGLRIVLSAQKQMNNNSGTLVVRNVSSDIMDIFDITGFSDILTIE